jgi:WD40 repeat protein
MWLKKEVYLSDNNAENIVERFNQLETQFNSLVKSLEQGSHPWGMIKASRVTGAMELPKISRIQVSETELIDIYHNSPQILSCLALTVALTPESYQKQTNQIIYLEQVSNGNYWIIVTEKNDYWLIPKDNIRINANSIKTVQSLFNCQGYEEIGMRKFSLIKPAKLSLIANGKQWKLEELGILDFSNSKAILITKNYIEQEQIDSQLTKLNQEILQIKDEYKKTINSLQEKQKLLEQELEKAAQERQQISSRFDQIISVNKALVDQIAKLSNEFESKKKVVDEAINNDFQTSSNTVNWQNIKLINTLNKHTNSVRFLAISPWKDAKNRQLLASGGFGNIIYVWDLDTGE